MPSLPNELGGPLRWTPTNDDVRRVLRVGAAGIVGVIVVGTMLGRYAAAHIPDAPIASVPAASASATGLPADGAPCPASKKEGDHADAAR